MRIVVAEINVFLIPICLVLLLLNCRESNLEKEPSVEIKPLTKSWESAWPYEETPENLSSIRAADCGECHKQIYEEWKQTTHAKALQDLQFQAEWRKDDVYLCVNCHTPLQNQQPYIVKGLINGDYYRPLREVNRKYDPELEKESITCAVCHVRNGFIIGPHGSEDAAHPTQKDSAFLAGICLKCHDVQDTVIEALVCTLTTGDEWTESPYAKAGRTCVHCHMPGTKRSIAEDGRIHPQSSRHTWPGMGIAKFYEDQDSVDEHFRSGLEIQIMQIDSNYYAGDSVHFGVKVTNEYAGHEIPTGDPERFVLIKLQVIDGNDEILKEKVERIGEEWEWYPVTRKLSDNSLKPKEARMVYLNYKISGGRTGLFLRVEVSNHRITEDNARSLNIFGTYPMSIVVFKKIVSSAIM